MELGLSSPHGLKARPDLGRSSSNPNPVELRVSDEQAAMNYLSPPSSDYQPSQLLVYQGRAKKITSAVQFCLSW